MVASDTDPTIQAKLDKMYAELPLNERANRYFSLWEFNRAMLYEGIKLRHPDATPQECICKFKEYLQSTFQK